MGMKKKQTANVVVAAVALLFVAAGVLAVGWMQGWFDKKDGAAVLTEIRGIVRMERGGVVYPVETDTALRAGDKIDCADGASAVIRADGCTLTLGERGCMEISKPPADFAAQILSGEVFLEAENAVELTLNGEKLAVADAVAWFCAENGAESVSVFAGQVGEAVSGQVLDLSNGAKTIRSISVDELSDFAVKQLLGVDSARKLCFTAEELEALRTEHKPTAVETEKPSPAPTSDAETIAESSATSESSATPEAASSEKTESQTKPAATATPKPAETARLTATPKPTAAPTPTPQPTATPEPVASYTCTISIRCDTILNNWDKLDPAKAGYVPDDGWILYTSVSFEEGETVLDALRRACSSYGISLEYSYSPVYGDYYIEGIHNLYEFDCGSQSGWMYTVNGWYPNYGCSSFTLSDGDYVEWRYTCSNGADIGG